MFAVGQTRLLSFDTYNDAGASTPAGSVTLVVFDPTGAQATHVVVASSAGHYVYALTFTSAGFWQWTWQGTGGTAEPRVQADAEFVGPSASSQYPSHAWCSNTDARATPQLAKIASSLNDEVLARACMAATEYLHTMTWRRFRGFRTVELRPCSPAAMPTPAMWLAWPTWQWAGQSFSALQADTSPIIDGPAAPSGRPVPEVVLPADVQQVRSVLINGATFTDWRLDSGRRLVRTDGQWWPQFQDLTIASTEDNTFAVEVVVGERENELARFAATELAAETYLAVADPSQCRIPMKVKTVQRPGATYQLQEVGGFVDSDGVVQLPLCQTFLGAFGKRRRRVLIYNVDIPEGTRRA